MKDCKLCQHATKNYQTILCLVYPISRPAEYMRHVKSECGPEGHLFEDKKVVNYE